MKVLVVDDDPRVRGSLARHLEGLGHEVLQAADGREACARFKEEHVPLVISDWVMPEMDGLALCRILRALPSERYVYLILLTSLEGRQRYLEGIRAGADDFLSKPLDGELLAARLHVAERILALQDQNRQLARLVPICAYCRKVRDDGNYWQEIEQYLAAATDLKLTHGICPACHESVVEPEIRQFRERRGRGGTGA